MKKIVSFIVLCCIYFPSKSALLEKNLLQLNNNLIDLNNAVSQIKKNEPITPEKEPVRKELLEIEQKLNHYAATLSLELQQALNWKALWPLFMERLKIIAPFFKQYIESNLTITQGPDYLNILTAFGFKPVAIHETFSQPYQPLLNLFHNTLSTNTIQGITVLINTSPLFNLNFIYQCYKDSINVSEEFKQYIQNNNILEKQWLIKQINRMPNLPDLTANKQTGITSDDIALLLGLVPTVYEKILQIRLKLFEYTIADFLNHQEYYYFYLLPGAVFLEMVNPYIILYAQLLNYLLLYTTDQETYRIVMGATILERLRSGMITTLSDATKQKLSEFIDQMFQGTTINHTNFFSTEFNPHTRQKEILIFMNNFLHAQEHKKLNA